MKCQKRTYSVLNLEWFYQKTACLRVWGYQFWTVSRTSTDHFGRWKLVHDQLGHIARSISQMGDGIINVLLVCPKFFQKRRVWKFPLKLLIWFILGDQTPKKNVILIPKVLTTCLYSRKSIILIPRVRKTCILKKINDFHIKSAQRLHIPKQINDLDIKSPHNMHILKRINYFANFVMVSSCTITYSHLHLKSLFCQKRWALRRSSICIYIYTCVYIYVYTYRYIYIYITTH